MKWMAAALFYAVSMPVACWAASAVQTDDGAIRRAAEVVEDYKLSSLKKECLYFDTADEGASYTVRVREKHSKACGGDPDLEPTVCFLQIRKRDGHTLTNAYSEGAEFQALRKPK